MADTPTKSGPNLGRASAILASGTTVSRVLGFVKALVLAQTIGATGLGTDAFAVANQLPNTVFVIVAGGVLNAVLVPQIVKAASHADGGRGYINKLVTLALAVLGVATLIATLLAPVLVTLAGFTMPPGQTALAIAFAYWCLPQIFFYGLYSVLGEVLNARNSFGPFTWAPVLNNVVAIVGLVAFNLLFSPGEDSTLRLDFWTPDKVAVLAGSATLGVAVQGLILFVFWRRVGLTFSPDFRWRGVGLGQAGRIASWTFGMLVVTQLAGLVETNVVLTASGNDVSTFVLSNAWLIFMLPHSIVAVSVATAYFTRMSQHASSGDLDGVRRDLSASIRVITLIMVLATVVLIAVAYTFSGFFTRTFSDQLAMGNVVIGFLIGLPPFSILFVVFRGFFALGDTRTPFYVTVFQAVVFSLGAIVVLFFVPKEFVGFAVAVVMSIAGTLQAVLAVILIRRRLGGGGGSGVARSLVRFAIAAIPTLGAGLVLAALFRVTDSEGFASATVPGSVISMIVIGLVMSLLYIGVLRLVKSPELNDALTPLLARLRRTS
ncbi:murein biosynthesis integral membrane protein MurJ [Agreia sp. VKM Ac-1783]|uniref:murein biosynthesis integral membrane protein MurJ n=1 Tax=Agreia sp. VKM Ac-1783 TaxID=1938889 RepID=UPI000A2AA72F|nr:murein biosynthesis integral membrane protein MurJ [Agreia sp. VKM Ac-1783]SMQ75430.1 putative peptidoglycan lipid II flippase [Agreia sp. VKM Ac-1783]